MRTNLFFLVITTSLFVLANSVYADSDRHSGSRLTEILVAEYIELGDLQPSWETNVLVREGKLRRSTYAAVEFVAVNVWAGTSSNLIVNDRAYVLPISEPLGASDIPNRGKTVIPIPIGLLHSGYNSIRFEAGPIDPSGENTHDDFIVADAVLVLSR